MGQPEIGDPAHRRAVYGIVTQAEPTIAIIEERMPADA